MTRDEAIKGEVNTKGEWVRGARFIRDPNLLLLTLIYLGLLIAGGSKLSAAVAMPHDSAEKALAYMTLHGRTIQLGSFFELISAIPLGMFVATTVSRMRFLGMKCFGKNPLHSSAGSVQRFC